MAGDITVHLYGGVHRFSEALLLDERDSGTNGFNVIYSAVPGEQPIISGGAQVTGWTLLDPGQNLWSAPAPPGLANSRQLYVNGVRAQRARGRLPVSVTRTPTGYTASSAEMASWRNQSDIEFVYTGGNSLWSESAVGLGDWTEPRCPVSSIDDISITMAQPCWANSTQRVLLKDGSRAANLVGPSSVGSRPTYVENAFELLGTPGQWYFDRSGGVIYYVPRPGEDLAAADVEVPILETLISGQGTRDNHAHHIVFSGLQFSYATWLQPSSVEGFPEIQANYMITGKSGYATQGLCILAPQGTCPYGDWTKTPGNVSFHNDDQIQFINDAFVHLGGAGLDLGDGSQGDLVQGCVFTDISANGLELGGVDIPIGLPSEITADNQIVDSHFYNVATEYRGGVGILVGYAQHTLIQHNQIDHLPYSAISLGWGGWPDKIRLPGLANDSQNNVIAYNLIFDHMLMLADGSGIYTQGLTGPSLADGEKIDGNVIRDQYGTGHGIYTDNGSSNITITNNVMFHTNHDNWGSRHGSYYDGHHGEVYDPLDIEDNYWQQADPDSSSRDVTLMGNRLINSLDQVPAAILDNAGLEPAYLDLLNRRFTAPSAPEPPSRVAASAGDQFAYLAWNPPVFEGGSPVESYVVTSAGGDEMVVSVADFVATGYVLMTGLINGTPYTFTVTAVNANGTSASSLPSRAVTPQAAAIDPPSAPTHVSALAGVGMASIHFQLPTSTGGSPLIAFTFTAIPGGRKVTLTGRTVLTLSGTHTIFGVVDGLQSGQSYQFDVAAVTVAGEGEAARTNPVTVQ